MTDYQKTMIDEMVVMGVSVTTIAERLQISRNTIKSYLHRKKKMMCAKIAEQFSPIFHTIKRKNFALTNAVCTTGIRTLQK